jgi:hypothetical protein
VLTSPKLQVKQSWERREYVDWKYYVLCNLTGKHPIPKTVKLRGYDRTYEQVYFHTYSLTHFSPFYEMFYVRGGQKVPKYVPENIGHFLNPRTVYLVHG